MKHIALSTLLLFLAILPLHAGTEKKRSAEAQALYELLQNIHADGKMLSGQMWAPWGIDEIEAVHDITGHYPAVRGHDLIHERDNAREVELMIDWHRRGGIVTLMWHWGAPTKGEGYNQSKMTIDVGRCFEEGTEEHKAMWQDLRRIAVWLKKLKGAHVPVLWRPMHEFDGKWFWYGKGDGSAANEKENKGGPQFVKLWQTVYNYLAVECQLDNLLWVLPISGEIDESYRVSPEYFDIVGPDAYNKNAQGALYNKVRAMYGPDVLIPLHECGTLPDPDRCLQDGTQWMWWMLWHTSFVTRHDKEEMRRIYNHPAVVTLEDLQRMPDRSLSRHNFMYAGEAKDRNVYLVRNGKVDWHYSDPSGRGEISDAVLMSDGNILIAHQYGMKEIAPDRSVVWSYDTPQGYEIHSARPVGDRYIVFVQCGTPMSVKVMDKRGNKIVHEFEVAHTPGNTHGQNRSICLTKRGTLLIASMEKGQVMEFNAKGKMLASWDFPHIWGVSALDNGNMLLTTNNGHVEEITRKGEVVWQYTWKPTATEPGMSSQKAYRLPGGNTTINSWWNEWGGKVEDAGYRPTQLVEVTPDGEIVWQLSSWDAPNLGPSTTFQLLSHPIDRRKQRFGKFK